MHEQNSKISAFFNTTLEIIIIIVVVKYYINIKLF